MCFFLFPSYVQLYTYTVNLNSAVMICISDFINSLSPRDTIIRPLEIEKANKRGAFICICSSDRWGKIFFSDARGSKFQRR